MNWPTDIGLRSTPLPASKWWQWLHSDPAACIRLWCFPCIGSGAAIWRPWITPLAGAAEIVSVCLPGRETRLGEAPLTRIEDLVSAFVAEIAPCIDERDVFCGHGMSALLAFEVSRRLQAERAAGPRGLIACGTRAPHHRQSVPPLHPLAPRAFVAAVEERYGRIPAELSARPEFLELLLPALRADLEAEESYRYEPHAPLDIPLLAVAGAADALAPLTSMLGWRLHTTARFEFGSVAGGHFFAIENPIETARRVRDFLATL